MRIGIDGLPLSQQLTGVGHYTLELARTMARAVSGDHLEIISPRSFLPEIANSTSRNGWPPNLSLREAPANFVTRRWWTIGASRYLAAHPLDLFHGTNFEVPLWPKQKCPTVLTVHDLSLLLHSDTHEARQVRRARVRLPLMIRAATLIVTPTESVRRELCKHLQVSADKAVAIPEAARSVFQPMPADHANAVAKRFGIDGDFLLYVGTIEPRKNLATLVRAFEKITTRRGSLRLVIAGKRGWLFEDLMNQVRRSGVADRIVFTGYVSDEDLRALYSSCRVFVYPSIYEGFGLPPLEAMACGAPVVASRIPSIVEVCRDSAILVEPRSVDALATALEKLLDDDDERARLSLAGARRATEFSWEQTAQLTRAAYNEAIKRFRGDMAK
jgi:glycosyltransferase involved in cell wall biosynthesis